MDAQRSEQQGSFVRWIAEAIWHRDFMDRTMIPFTGYCDESEDQPRSRYLIAAGLIAPTNRWIQFEYNWKLVLAKYKIDYFHAIEFYNNKGPWRRGTEWDDDNYRARFLAELLSVVQSTECKPDVVIVSLVWKEAYKAIFPKHDIVKRFSSFATSLVSATISRHSKPICSWSSASLLLPLFARVFTTCAHFDRGLRDREHFSGERPKVVERLLWLDLQIT